MKKSIITYRSSLPCFLGGANHQAEFRLNSFKGILRFWWRSLQWGQVADHSALAKKESSIFGSSDQKIGRSKVRLRLAKPLALREHKPGSQLREGRLAGANYLAYGKINAFESRKSNKKAGQFELPALEPFEFTLEVTFSGYLSDEDVASVRSALRLIGAVGALGGRSRRGWGSLTLTKWEDVVDENRTPNREIVTEEPDEVLLNSLRHATSLPDWTAWSSNSRIAVLNFKNSNDPLTLLDEIGKELLRFRSWGNGGMVLGNETEEHFKDDHNLFKNMCSGSSLPVTAGMKYPKRVAFGLPHNYGQRRNEHVEPDEEGLDRRASPLMIHIHQLNRESTAYGVVSFLPSRFLPGTSPRVRAFGSSAAIDTTIALYKPIEDFLDRLVGKGTDTNTLKSALIGREI